VTDLWNNYHLVAGRYFPDAALVADKFHVLRMANEAVEMVRKHNRREIMMGRRPYPHTGFQISISSEPEVREEGRQAVRGFRRNPLSAIAAPANAAAM